MINPTSLTTYEDNEKELGRQKSAIAHFELVFLTQPIKHPSMRIDYLKTLVTILESRFPCFLMPPHPVTFSSNSKNW